jgi:hypothetical protein
MIAILTKIWGFLSTKAAEWIGIALAALGTYAAIKKSGENVIELAEEKKTLEGVRIKDEINTNVDNLSNTAVDKQLSEWK